MHFFLLLAYPEHLQVDLELENCHPQQLSTRFLYLCQQHSLIFGWVGKAKAEGVRMVRPPPENFDI
jgi:hypothetical protein